MVTRWKQLILAIGLFLGTSVISQAQSSPAPRVWSMEPESSASGTVTFTVTFSEAVEGVDTHDFRVIESQDASISNVRAGVNTSIYLVDVSYGQSISEIVLVLIDDDSIVNEVGIPLGGIGLANGNAISTANNVTPSNTVQLQQIDNQNDTHIDDTPINTPNTQFSAAAIDTPAEARTGAIKVGFLTSIDLTSADIPVISYLDQTNYDIKLAVCDDIICQSPFITTIESTGIVGLGTSIALTSTDIPIISYVDYTNRQLKLAICNDELCTNPTTSIIDNSSMQDFSISLALTSTDIPIISYVDYDNNDLKLAICTDATCSGHTSIILDTGDTKTIGLYASLALTSTDAPVVSYYDQTNTDLTLAICTDATCTSHTITTVESTPNNVGKYSSVALTSTDMPVISYFDQTNNDLRLAICTDVSCTNINRANIDSTSDVVGLHTSIALTAADAPVISYYDFTNTNLKLAICNNASCATKVISTLDNSGYVGEYNSIALTSTEVAIVSYYDYTNSTLALQHNPIVVDQGNPNSFAKLTPSLGSTVFSATQTLSWASVPNAASYEYCVATTIATCTSWINTGTNTSATVTDLVHGTYYWHVRATNIAGTTIANRGTPWSFSVDLRPTAFGKSSPANNSMQGATTATLTWDSVSNATSYEYCISTSATSCTSWTSTGSATTATVSGLRYTTYYWQVRATNGAGTTLANNSTPWRLTIVQAPATFTKSAPANNATNQKTSVTLSWAASTRATSYEYCVALSTATCTTWKSTGTARTVTVTGLAKNKAYFWQVRAINAGGTTIATAPAWKFTTAP